MTVRPERAQGLGRGLAALIPQRSERPATGRSTSRSRASAEPDQPRRRFGEAEMATLAASIREHGVLQPILVAETLDGYQLIAGERRVRAAAAAGLERIPASSATSTSVQRLELALVENLQREDLDPIEAAHGFRRLIDEFGFTHEEIAERVGSCAVDRREHAAPARPRAGRPGRDRRRPDQRGPRPRARRA